MKPEAQRIAIAEACGFDMTNLVQVGEFSFQNQQSGSPFIYQILDYPFDLNAMHEAEKVLTDDWQQEKYLCKIQTVIDGGRTCFKVSESDHWQVARATASQRAEAFLRTIGKWEE